MTDATAPPLTFDWDAEGLRIGQTLDRAHAIVVVGGDVDATARVALAIGRAQASRRRAVVVDLLGDAPPLRELVPAEDVHGVVDSFQYGVSLTRITHAVPGSERLFVVPTGTEPPDFVEICTHPQWRKIVARSRESDGLLVVAVPAFAPRLEDLVASTDGAVVVGDRTPPGLPAAFIIGLLRELRDRPTRPAYPADDERAGSMFTRWPAFAGLLLLIALAGIVLWLADRPFARGGKPSVSRLPTNESPTARVLKSSADSTIADSVELAGIPGVPEVTNPTDAARAAQFSVELMAANTQAGAILKLQRDGRNLPAATFSPLLIGEARWFKVYAGAFTVREDADSLLARLGRSGLLGPGASVVSVPFTFLIDMNVPPAGVSATLARYAERGEPVYALRQDDGTVWLCVGAYQSPDAAASYAESLRASGTKPVLVYRKGRVF